jgi:hypothetical protein
MGLTPRTSVQSEPVAGVVEYGDDVDFGQLVFQKMYIPVMLGQLQVDSERLLHGGHFPHFHTP